VRTEQVLGFYGIFSVCLRVTLNPAHASLQIMMRYLLAFLLGALTVTGFVVATGARAGGLVVLGFLTATALYGVVTFLIGPQCLMRFLLLVAGEPERPRPTPRIRTVARRSEVEQEVVSALVLQGVSRRAALKATADAALRAPQEFEQLFKTAIGCLT
jgi:hypothetical protein